ncbi:mCG127543 [Mus musculus]|nr:mCG127543 [Mus musculus]
MREFGTERRKEEKWRPLFSFLSLTVLKFGCFRVQKTIHLSWSGKCPSYKYLQLIMLQLLVFPFSLPSSQMIFFFLNITVFKNYFFNVEKIWKSY